MRRKDDRWAVIAGWATGIILLCIALAAPVQGASEWPLRLPFDGATADTCFVKMFVDSGAATGYDSISIDSFFSVTEVDTSFTVSSSFSYMRVVSFNFYGTGDLDGYTEYLPALVTDSNRTEQGGAGSGTYTVNIKFLDTSTAPDAFIPNVNVDLRGWNTSVLLGTDYTNESGIATFGTDADSVAFKGVGPSGQYVWPINWEDSVPNSGDLIDTVMGYFIDVPVSSGSQVCAVTVIVLDNGGRPARNIPVTAYLPRSNLKDSAGYAVANFTQSQKTDTQGRATFECRWSSYLIPATKWWFAIAAPGVSQTRKNVTVPRQSSYTLQF